MKNKKMLFISYIDFGNFDSGSSVRPQMIYDAFCELGYDVKLLQTRQNKRKQRREAVKEINSWLNFNIPDFCYIESPTSAIFNKCDHKLIKILHNMGVKTAMFYRDADYNKKIKSSRVDINKFKAYFIRKMCEYDLKIYKKNLDIVYFSSKTMADYFDLPDKRILPPACVKSFIRKYEHNYTSIYVGSLSKLYDCNKMFEAFNLINKDNNKYPLIVVCRKQDVNFINEKYIGKSWLNIKHASGKKNLEKYYKSADIGIFSVKKCEYMDFAIPVKMFEYMEFGLPIISTNVKEVKNIIDSLQSGITVDDKPQSFAKAIEKIFSSQDIYKQYADNVAKAIPENTWIARAKKVEKDLISLKEKQND